MFARTRTVLAALPLAVMLALVGCGTGDDGGTDDDVASADGSTPGGNSESAEPLSEDDRHAALLEYAQCLRDNGLDVEDPAPGEGIQLEVDGDPGEADAAIEACEHLAPPAPPGGDTDDEARENMLAYAQCMRDNGVEQFADPRPGEGIGIGPEVVEDPDYESAEEICGEVFGGGSPRPSDMNTAGSDV